MRGIGRARYTLEFKRQTVRLVDAPRRRPLARTSSEPSSPVKGRSPPEAARFQRALDRDEGSENKARQEVDGLACRQDDTAGRRRP